MTKVIKRNHKKEDFDIAKIITVLHRAAQRGDEETPEEQKRILSVASSVWERVKGKSEVSSAEIESLIEEELIRENLSHLAKNYILGCYEKKNLKRRQALDDSILGIIQNTNEAVGTENANKNPQLLSTQRDYMAGEISKDIAKRLLFPPEVVKAHEEGLIHIHDLDYVSLRMTNCELINIQDMLDNGTVISGVKIDPPKSLLTAATVTTQISQAVAASTFGGQSINLAHLAGYVDVSRKKYRKQIEEENKTLSLGLSEEQIRELAEKRVRKEITDSVQTMQYQWSTLMSTNGQAPFITLFLYLGDARNPQEKKDLALLIEEVLKQRIQGVKNQKGVYISPTFPKLIYTLDEENITEDAPYFYLTKLAAECSAKRMVPDYISAKKMRELKNGDVYSPMGCVDGGEVIDYKIKDTRYVESFQRAWDRLSFLFGAKLQPNHKDLIVSPEDVTIYDSQKGEYVKMQHIIRNHSKNWMELTFSNGRILDCTTDHPLVTLARSPDGSHPLVTLARSPDGSHPLVTLARGEEMPHPFATNRGLKRAEELTEDDEILIDTKGAHLASSHAEYQPSLDICYLLGLILCDGEYSESVSVTLGLDEKDISENFTLRVLRSTDYQVTEKIRNRGERGNYLQISLSPKPLVPLARGKEMPQEENGIPKKGMVTRLSDTLKTLFGGTAKKNRHVPNFIFRSFAPARYAFLAGMIDADGYINANGGLSKVQIGSTNKELALQEMYLAQSLGLPARVYRNHYQGRQKEKVRYLVEFVPDETLLSFLVCEKKKKNCVSISRKNHSSAENNLCHITGKKPVEKEAYSYDVTTSSSHFTVSGIYSHNCRSFLSVDEYGYGEGGKPKYWGRFNKGVVTLNLPDIALSSGGDMDSFWRIFDERMENLIYPALITRHNTLVGTKSDVAPILWQHGAIARLAPGEVIDPLLYDGYSTISIGYAGLYETVKFMTGLSHTDSGAKTFAIQILDFLNEKARIWNDHLDIGFSVYGTPLESTTYSLAKALKKRFGEVPGITDKDYVTNSYHVPVFEEIGAFEKLGLESAYQDLSPGGSISYIEVPNMQGNLPAMLSVLRFMYDHNLYSEINTKSDYCEKCGYTGEIRLVRGEDGKRIWECPNCKNRDQQTMSVVRRVCGYLGDVSKNGANQGRLGDIEDRVLHLK